MKTQRLGNSDMEITTLGFGAWAIGGTGYEYAWGPQDDRDSIAAIHRALELGINWIDTAPAYGIGHSEEIVAQALSSWSGARPYVFTKCGLRWDQDGKIFKVLKGESIRAEVEESLSRLQVETIDLMQIHWPTDVPGEIEEAWSILADLQQAGKLRWIGVSNFDVAQLQKVGEIAPVTSLQPPYSLLRRGIEAEILSYCIQTGIGVIVYSPMYSGLLTGAMTRQRVANLPDTDWRKRDAEFQEPLLSRNLGLVDCLSEISARQGYTPAEAAIAWTLRHPGVTAAIVGARSVKQVEGVVRATDFRFSQTELVEVENIIAP